MFTRLYDWMSTVKGWVLPTLCFVACLSLITWAMASTIFFNGDQTSTVLPLVANIAWVVGVISSVALFGGAALYFLLTPIVRLIKKRMRAEVVRVKPFRY